VGSSSTAAEESGLCIIGQTPELGRDRSIYEEQIEGYERTLECKVERPRTVEQQVMSRQTVVLGVSSTERLEMPIATVMAL